MTPSANIFLLCPALDGSVRLTQSVMCVPCVCVWLISGMNYGMSEFLECSEASVGTDDLNSSRQLFPPAMF